MRCDTDVKIAYLWLAILDKLSVLSVDRNKEKAETDKAEEIDSSVALGSNSCRAVDILRVRT